MNHKTLPPICNVYVKLGLQRSRLEKLTMIIHIDAPTKGVLGFEYWTGVEVQSVLLMALPLFFCFSCALNFSIFLYIF